MNESKTYAETNSTRRSRKQYTGKILDRALIREIVAEASLAPSASNMQPWRIVVAQGAALERCLPALTGDNPVKIKSAGTLVIVFGDPNVVDEKAGSKQFYDSGLTSRHDFAILNSGLIAMNIMLAAWSRGIATRPMIGFDPCELRKAAGVARHWVPAVIMAMGYPDEKEELPPRSRKPVEEALSFIN